MVQSTALAALRRRDVERVHAAEATRKRCLDSVDSAEDLTLRLNGRTRRFLKVPPARMAAGGATAMGSAASGAGGRGGDTPELNEHLSWGNNLAGWQGWPGWFGALGYPITSH